MLHRSQQIHHANARFLYAGGMLAKCFNPVFINLPILCGLADAKQLLRGLPFPQQLLHLFAPTWQEPAAELLQVVSFPFSSPAAEKFSERRSGVCVTDGTSTEPVVPERGRSGTKSLVQSDQREDWEDAKALPRGSHGLTSPPARGELWKHLLGLGALFFAPFQGEHRLASTA